MDAYNYNAIVQELCLLPNNKINLGETKPEIKPEIKGGFKNNLNQIKTLNSSNYTIVELPKLLTGTIKKTPLVMQGGSDFNQTNNLVYNNPEKLSIITKFYYDNYQCLMNSTQIINVLVSFIYNEFTDSNKELLTIITPEYIKSIPEMYVFNFTDKVMGDLLKACPNIKQKFKILDENILVVNNTENLQTGGYINTRVKLGGKHNKRIDTSDDKTVEEKIKNNINTLTTFLKSKSLNQQKGGEQKANLVDINREINIFKALPINEQNKPKKVREMQEKSNMWTVELLEDKIVNKVIKDGEFNLARYYLESTDPNLRIIIDFVNDNAPILTLKDVDRIKIDIPNQLKKVSNYGSLKPTFVTDQLKEYFNKKYNELLKIRSLGESKESKVPIEPLEKIQFILSQKGGLSKDKKLEHIFEEKCFTSKQLGLFLQKVSAQLRDFGKVIDESDITSIQADIEKLREIEKNLIKNYKIFENYIKIQDVYPDTGVKEITINHMKNVIDSNQQLFDKYGNINNELLDVIDKVERYSQIKEYTDTKELNQLSQNGGRSFTNGEKSYLKFNTQYDVEHFTARNFQKILEEMKKDG
jgi:hypothetical protein